MKPTRIAIIADCHGILPSLKAVLADLLKNPPDEIIVAGDFIGGPQPVKTLSLLQEVGCRFILGNGEANLLKMKRGTAPGVWWTHSQFVLGRWIFDRLSEDHFNFLENLTEQYVFDGEGCDPLRVVHGSPWDINKEVFPHKEPEVMRRALAMIPENLLVFAHTHLPDVIPMDGKVAVNPGSTGNNLNGDTRVSYAVLAWDGQVWQPELHYVPNKHEEVIKAFKETGFLEGTRPLGRSFLESIFTAENTALDYILYAFDLAHQAGYGELDAVPDEIWLGAEASFPWRFDF